MKKIMFFIALSIVITANAQSRANLVLVSGTQENFVVSIDNARINTQGLNEIAVTGLQGDYYRVTIRFANHFQSVFQANLYVPPMSEIVYEVYPGDAGNPNGNYLIRDIYPRPAQTHLNNPYAIFEYGGSGYAQNQAPVNNNINATQNNQVNINIINNAGTQPTSNTYGNGGCNAPVSEARFEDMLRRVGNQMMSDDKLRLAKQIVKTNCITSYQLTKIMESFSFDDARLELAKFAYDYVYDIGNFYKVPDALHFLSNRKELEEYIN